MIAPVLSNTKPRILREIDAIDYARRNLREKFPAMTEAQAAREVDRFLRDVVEYDARKDGEMVGLTMQEVFRVTMAEQVQIKIAEEAANAKSDNTPMFPAVEV